MRNPLIRFGKHFLYLDIIIIIIIFFNLQIYSSRDLEESINKIREILSDDKHDWEQRVAAVSMGPRFEMF